AADLCIKQFGALEFIERLKGTSHRASPRAFMLALRPKDNRDIQVSDRRITIVVPKAIPVVIANAILDQSSMIELQEIQLSSAPFLSESSERDQKCKVARAQVDMPALPIDNSRPISCRDFRIKKIPPMKIAVCCREALRVGKPAPDPCA